MKMNMSRLLVYGGVLVCSAALGVERFREHREDVRIAEVRLQADARERVAFAAHVDAPSSLAPFPDLAMGAVPSRYPRPASDWQVNEKSFHEKLLAQGTFDVLVVPFQVWGWGFDRATRSLMTAELAAVLAQAQKVKIPDPYLVSKALGDGQRQLKQEEIYRLADAIGAKRIVWGYAGHDRKGKMAVAVLSQQHGGGARNGAAWTTAMAVNRFDDLAFDDEMPPIAVYQAALPRMVKPLGIDVALPLFSPVESRLEMAALPPSPMDLLAATDDNPARDAYVFLLYGLLTPAHLERTKERFAEKALLALSRLAPAAPDYRALRARAYMALGLRMAAIKVLDEPQTDEEKGLLAALNGNFPEVRAMAERQNHPLKRLIQKLDENSIGTSYGVVDEKKSASDAAALKLPGSILPFLVTRAFLESEPWEHHDNASLKTLLDHELPVKAYSLEDITRGALLLGDAGKINTAVDLSVFNHGRKFIEADAARWCCQFTFARPGPLDYLDLLQSMGHDNLIRRINFLSAVQGRPEAAIAHANSIDPVYKGNPYYAMERSSAERRLARQATGAEKDGWVKASKENAFNAYFWEQGQSLVATSAIDQYTADGGEYYGRVDNLYYTDIPYRPYYWTWADGGQGKTIRGNELAAVKNATTEIHTVSALLESYRWPDPDEGEVDALLKSIEGRFAGSPSRNSLLAQEAMRRGDSRKAENLFRENIRLTPGHWLSYHQLAILLLESGDVNAAAGIFRSYPGFMKDAGEHRVQTANYAYEAGSYFYWFGHFELAEPFYRIAASQRSGAASEMTSALRLKLLAGDMEGAMAGTLERVQRYRDTYAYRDYFGMLHAGGHSKDVWPAFNFLAKDSQRPHVWETALVGHHKAGLSEAEVVAWAKQNGLKEGGDKALAAIYLLRFGTTDRIPSKDLPAMIDSVDIPRWKIDAYSMPVYEGHSVLKYATGKKAVRSAFGYFAQAYRAIKLKEFASAKSIFDEAAVFYDPTDQSTYSSYTAFLPYYAFAAAKAGDIAGIEKILGSIAIQNQRFDYLLARSILAAAAGKTDEALQSLRLARYRRPHTETRSLLTQYTYGEVAEMVAELTGSPKARALALDWAKKAQKFEPWQAWSYALEAKLATDPVERKRAMAMAYYLDPRSERLSGFRKSDIEAAVKLFGGANPFLAKTQPVPKKDVI